MIIAAWAMAAVAQDCVNVEIGATIPAEGAVVPTDTRIAFEYEGCRETPQDHQISVLDSDGGEVQAWFWSWSPTESYGLEVYELDAPLAPESAYTLEIVSDGGSTQVAFTTGEGPATALSGAPVLELTSDPEWHSFSNSVAMELTIEPIEDPTRTSLLEVRDGDGVAHYTGVLPAPGNLRTLALHWELNNQPEEVCVQAVQIDATGQELAAEPVCRAPIVPGDDGGGCGCGSRTPAGAWPLALVLVLARRVRSRSAW